MASEQQNKRQQIVETAKKLAIDYHASIYSQTGKSTTAMDCSWFVYLVFKEVFPDFEYLNTTGLLASSQFAPTAAPRPGDLVLFPAGKIPAEMKKGNTAIFPNHVGIVIDAQSWVGRQTSSLGIVLTSNPWWGSREYKYLVYSKLAASAPQ